MKQLAISLATSLLVVMAVSVALFGQEGKFTTSGYFNGIKMTSSESGDYGGMAVYLTESDGTLYALVTVAEGAILTPILVTAKVTGKNMRGIEFTLPGDNGSRKFVGTVSAGNLVLTSEGTRSSLKRECAETFSNITVGSGGDYGGTEVYLTDAGGTWYALVTMAEGVLLKPVLLNAFVTGKNYEKVVFSLRNDNGERKFSGTRATSSLTLVESGTKSVLKRRCYQ